MAIKSTWYRPRGKEATGCSRCARAAVSMPATPRLQPKRAAYGVRGLRSGSGQRRQFILWVVPETSASELHPKLFWDYLAFQLPTPPPSLPNGEYPQADPDWPPASIDGSITIHYNVSSDSRMMAETRRASAVLHEPVDEGVSWNDAMPRMDPAARHQMGN